LVFVLIRWCPRAFSIHRRTAHRVLDLEESVIQSLVNERDREMGDIDANFALAFARHEWLFRMHKWIENYVAFA
jgi:hypothetical protein